MKFPFNTRKLGRKAFFEDIDDLVPVDIYGVIAPDVWRTRDVAAEELATLGIKPEDHVICEFDEGFGSELYDCGQFASFEARVRANIVGFSQALADKMAIARPRWYRLPEREPRRVDLLIVVIY